MGMVAALDGYIGCQILGDRQNDDLRQRPNRAERLTVHATYYVDDDISVSGNAYNNQSGLAANVVLDGVGTNNSATISGNGTWIGVVNAPGFDVTISGNGSYVGALIGNTLTISGNASFHYDQALNANSTTTAAIGNYAFASWFEDTR